MKFNLSSQRRAGDPFGEGPAVVETNDRPAAAGSFTFAPDAGFVPRPPAPIATSDPLAGLGGSGASSGSMASVKITLASQPKIDDPFTGAGASIKTAAVNLANLETEPLEIFDSPVSAPQGSFSKSADAEFQKFAQFTKIQEQDDGNVLVWGIATLEQPDLDGEICDYDAAKDAYQAWSLAAAQRTSAAGQQVSLGPIRYQHSAEPAGKATKIEYNDDAREIWLGSVPISDDVREQLQQGFLTGYSQGGSYGWRKCTDCGKSLTLQQANNYCPNCKQTVPVLFGLKRLTEVSYVDSPCTGKGFDYVKADGSHRFIPFAKRAERQSAEGITVLSTESIFRKKIWKSVALIGGRKRTIVHWDDGHLVV